MDHVILDIEIQKPIGGPGGLTWNDTDTMGVSVAILYEMEADRYVIYGADDLKALRDRLEAAERITTWNGWSFDLPVLYGLRRPMTVDHLAGASDDMLARIWQARGRFEKGWKLEEVGQATLGRGKTDDGALAPIFYQQGQWVKLINYCLGDVHLTRDLCRVADDMGMLKGARGTVMLRPWSGVPPEEVSR
jgi:DEAD/DEAH box helicase domain-containing protein